MADQAGLIGDVEVAVVPEFQTGGIWLGEGLTVQPHLEVSCARVVGQSETLASSLGDAGFGPPFMEAQSWLRVAPNALNGGPRKSQRRMADGS